MLYGFIGAMQLELDGIRSHMTNISTESISGIDFVRGKIGETELVTAVCGIGKVNAAICAQTMILKYSPCAIINTGVAGAVSRELSIGDVVVADSVVQHDMDTSAVGDPVGYVSGIGRIYFETDKNISNALAACLGELNVHSARGIIATGDQFICTSEKKKYLSEVFGATACEMEAASIGHTCAVNGVPFSILRAISDKADEGAVEDYPSFARSAAEKYVDTVVSFAKKYAAL